MKRMVVKIGSSSLVDAEGYLADEKIVSLVQQIAALQQEGQWQVVLVSSGAVATGVQALAWPRQLAMPEKQAAAAVGQGILLEKYQQFFQQFGFTIAQLLLTRSDMDDRKRFIHIRNTMESLLRNQIVPIVNENDTVAVDEIRFGDNDTLGSLVALVVEADLYVILTDIDGLYTAPPELAEAEKIHEVHAITPDVEQLAGGAGSLVGTGGMQTKIAAAKIATRAGIAVEIASSQAPKVLARIAAGEQVGTHFYAQPRLPSKKSWLAFGTRSEGRVIVDQGAKQALIRDSRSLLLAGIVAVEGSFAEGAVVDIIDGEGQLLGKGMVSFAAHDIAALLARREQGERLAPLPACIHRDHLVILLEEDETNE